MKPGERRVAVTPSDARTLIADGFRVVVERSTTRCFPDNEYERIGAEMVDEGAWIADAPAHAIVVGLKEVRASR